MNWTRTISGSIDMTEAEDSENSYQVYQGLCHSHKSEGLKFLLRIWSKSYGYEISRMGTDNPLTVKNWMAGIANPLR